MLYNINIGINGGDDMKRKKVFNRYYALTTIMFIIFGIIIYRLCVLQIVNGDQYTQLAAANSNVQLQTVAPRGNITDCNGNILATDIQTYKLTYMETDTNKYDFIPIMNSVFKILNQNNENIEDSFELKINPFSFVFKNTDGTDEIRFKKDRGMDQEVYDKMFKGVKNPPSINNLSVEQQNKINAELLKITPEETFGYLVKKYDLTPEGDFMNLVAYYKTNHDSAIKKICERYKPVSEDSLKELLISYYKAKNDSDKNNIKTKLIKLCGVDKLSYSIDEQRMLMVVKDALYMQRFASYKPVTISESIKKDTSFIIDQKNSDLPGVNVENNPVRTYPNGELASSILGYISKISSSNKDKYELKGYDTSSDYVGATGIEAAFEENLRGKSGASIVNLSNNGTVQQTLAEKQAYPGQTIQLTIDKNLQAICEGILDDTMANIRNKGQIEDVTTSNATRGAVVVEKVNTGEILAMASRPGFDPNVFTQTGNLTPELIKEYLSPDYNDIGSKYISKYGLASLNGETQQQVFEDMFPKVDSKSTDPNAVRYDRYDIFPKPMFPYATMSLIPSGSTIKPCTALAGLESGVVGPLETIDDPGYFDYGPNTRQEFKSDGSHGLCDIIKALTVSSNPYFMTVAKRLKQNTSMGDDGLAQYGWKLGLGVKPDSGAKASTGIEISENFGQIYNAVSIKKIKVRDYLPVVINRLKSGNGNYNGSKISGSFTPVDLNDESIDSDEVKSSKSALRDCITNSIKTGSGDSATYKKLLTQWFAVDPQYKDKKISTGEINNMISAITYIAISDAFSQCDTSNPAKISNICDASIGQGIDNFTPLQMVNYIATLVNGGTRYQVHLVDKIIDSVDGSVVSQSKPVPLEKNQFDPENIKLIIQGMKGVTGDGGTAAAAFQNFPLETGGKTGTAQSSTNQKAVGRTNYSEYIGFAPADNPQIAVYAVIFDGGYGAEASTIARTAYEYYFKDEIQKIQPGYVTPSQYDYTKYLK